MKRNFTLMFLCLVCMLCTKVDAQEGRYLSEVFDNVKVTKDVTYSVNATVLLIPVVGEAVPEELKMDIYEPEGDTETARPLVLVFHTGNFLPNVTNGQIAGTRQDNENVEICTQLAKRGYTAASVSYRLGWNPLADSQPVRALGLIQAAYRGVQDGRAAVRYFKKDVAENGNTYGIDPEKITAWGNGTGSYLVYGMTGLSFYNEIPLASNPTGKFLLDTDGDGVPDAPMVAEAFHGDVNGDSLTVVPFDAYGLMAGDTTNYPSNAGYSSDFNLAVNIGGALGDISWLDDNTTPIVTVQSAYDIFAPYDDAILVVPTTGDAIVQVQGGLAVARKQQELGNNDIFDNFNFVDASTQLAIANSATAGHDYYSNLLPIVDSANSAGIDEGVVINWWNENDPSPANGQGMGIPWNLLPHPSGGTFHTQGLILNEGMSAEKARANIATIMEFVAPRACVALGLEECVAQLTKTEDLLSENTFAVSPNPASDFINISSGDLNFTKVEIYNVAGQLMDVQNGTDRNNATVNVANLTSGMYVVKVYFEEGVAAKKVMVK